MFFNSYSALFYCHQIKSAVSVLDHEGLMQHRDHILKNRFATLLREKVLLQRLPGVFPQGLQPRTLVVVVDEKIPYVKLNSIKLFVSKVLKGKNMDAMDFFELIRNDDVFDDDNVLYVVIPWLNFFLNNLKVQPKEAQESFTPPVKDGEEYSQPDMDEFVRSVNATKDLRFNPIIETDYVGKVDFISSLDPVCKAETSLTRGAVAMAHRAILAAHQLRTAVLGRCLNSEVVFCGYPISGLSTQEAQQSLAHEVSYSVIFICFIYKHFY